MLSQNMMGGDVSGMCKSRRMEEIQDISTAVWAKERYSGSMLERETIFYFFADHEMQLLPKKVQKPIVER